MSPEAPVPFESIDLREDVAIDVASSVKAADPCTVVIFGASGDLARRKLIPALYELACHESLARRFSIIGFARTVMSDEAFQARVEEAIRKHTDAKELDDAQVRQFVKSFVYVPGEYHHPEAFRRL